VLFRSNQLRNFEVILQSSANDIKDTSAELKENMSHHEESLKRYIDDLDNSLTLGKNKGKEFTDMIGVLQNIIIETKNNENNESPVSPETAILENGDNSSAENKETVSE
jgi:hypothetical protein